MTRVASSWGVQGTTTVDPLFYTRTVEKYLKDYLSKDHGAILNIYTTTDIADFGRNIVTIVHVDEPTYKFPISSRLNAATAYVYIVEYAYRYGYIEQFKSISIIYGNFSTSKEQLTLDIARKQRKVRLAVERKGNVYYLPHVKNYMDTELIDLNFLAAYLGLSRESAKQALEQKAVESRDAERKPKPCRTPRVLTVVRLRATYEALLEDCQFVNPTLAPHERLRAAVALVKTYDRLRKRDSTFKDSSDQLRAARKLVNSVKYQRRKLASISLQI